ncbi:putative phosphoesterase [Bacillus pakistanensis]|uniref:Phosphoesterase n=1 Tax=Rossellomorea pakistanensis TaxID=992288 RepID=A0ABS2N8Q2_9BACI|nr:putative phosphoesterase [Bacillus pakistanensis]
MADTHLKKYSGLPQILEHHLNSADLILHAGDWQSIDVYEALCSFGIVEGVYGNVDGDEIKNLVPKKKIIESEGKRIGLVHGDGKGKTTEKRAQDSFIEGEVDLIIFGHSHIPYSRYSKGTLLFNPGSPTAKRKLPYYSFGIITIQNHRIETQHIYFS